MTDIPIHLFLKGKQMARSEHEQMAEISARINLQALADAVEIPWIHPVIRWVLKRYVIKAKKILHEANASIFKNSWGKGSINAITGE